MHKKYTVDLESAERSQLEDVVKRLKGSSQKVKRANILLKADASGPGWTDAKIAESLDCRTKTVENVRKRFVEEGFEIALNGNCLLYTSPSPRDQRGSRMPSSA